VAGGAVLVWRRHAPVLVFGVTWALTMIGGLWGPSYVSVAPLTLGLYTVAAHCLPKVGRVALALALLSNASDATQQMFLGVHHGFGSFMGVMVFYGLLTVPSWAAGRWVREHRRQVEATQAVAAERARIAGELHDIVAHSVTVMMLQAAVAKRLIATDPAGAAQTAADIGDQGKQAMSELRRMLTVLRADDSENKPGKFAVEHQRGLADIAALVDTVNRTGMSVGLEESGEHPRLDPSVDLTAYRIVQEALTNTTRYAGLGAQAMVRWSWSGTGDLVVQVNDAGDGKPDHAIRGLSTGHGLLGLRERVEVIGGRLEAGPTAEGGFQVVATLPVAGSNTTTP
jgi:signal transduction histidine kinase